MDIPWKQENWAQSNWHYKKPDQGTGSEGIKSYNWGNWKRKWPEASGTVKPIAIYNNMDIGYYQLQPVTISQCAFVDDLTLFNENFLKTNL